MNDLTYAVFVGKEQNILKMCEALRGVCDDGGYYGKCGSLYDTAAELMIQLRAHDREGFIQLVGYLVQTTVDPSPAPPPAAAEHTLG